MTFHTAIAGMLLVLAAPVGAETFHACDQFITTLPATLSTQGVYCLSQDVSTAQTSGNAISIANNNITIDCNGYKIGGLGGGASTDAYGIFAMDRLNITVRHCSVRGFRVGVALIGPSASGGLIEDNRLDQNRVAAIYTGGKSHTIRRNLISDTGGRPATNAAGIRAGGDAVEVSDNSITHVFASGTDALTGSAVGIAFNGAGSVARGNRIQNLLRGGTGETTGIDAYGAYITVEGNSMVLMNTDAAAAGRGVWGGIKTACRDNVISGWTNALELCSVALDNLSAP